MKCWKTRMFLTWNKKTRMLLTGNITYHTFSEVCSWGRWTSGHSASSRIVEHPSWFGLVRETVIRQVPGAYTLNIKKLWVYIVHKDKTMLISILNNWRILWLLRRRDLCIGRWKFYEHDVMKRFRERLHYVIFSFCIVYFSTARTAKYLATSALWVKAVTNELFVVSGLGQNGQGRFGPGLFRHIQLIVSAKYYKQPIG